MNVSSQSQKFSLSSSVSGRALSWLAVLTMWTAVGCTSINVVVGGETIMTVSEDLQECGGARFRLTIMQELLGEDPVSASAETVVAGGRVRFTSSDFSDIQLNNIVEIKLEILEVPGTQRNCRFEAGQTVRIDRIILERVGDTGGDPTYAVPISRFK